MGMPILVGKEEQSGWYMAAVVPSKGKCTHAVQKVEEMMDSLGYTKLVMKTDQEPAIMELKDTVRRSRTEEIIPEESPVEDSRSNGYIERAIQEVQGQIRTIKSAVEGRYKEEMAPDHPAIPWMVTHAAGTLNRHQVGKDGMTAYRRLRGKDHEVKVAEFGECVLYMTPGITGKNKLDARWEKGIWLGIRDRSGEIIVGTPEGCMKVRSIRRRPDEERWIREGWHSMRGVP